MANSFRIGEFTVEPSLHSVSGPAGAVRLEPKIMLVLLCLAEQGADVVSKEHLMRAAWPDTFVGDDVLTRAISELRRVFGDDARDPRFIETIPKSGYRLIAPVKRTSGNHGPGATPPETAIEMQPSRDDGLSEGDRARSLPRSWRRRLAAVAIVAAVLLVGVVGQRMTASPSAAIVRTAQLTFAGQVAFPTFSDAEFFPALATDGGRVYFTRTVGNRYPLAQAPLSGGEVVAIPTPFDHALLLNLSPDRSRLLVREFVHAQIEGPLWVIPTLGGAPLRLGTFVAHDGGWSPDGKRLVFARGEEVYLARSDGTDPRTLVTTPGRAFWLRWSPDRARLRFTLVGPQGNTRSLWEISADGHDLRPVPLERGEHDLDCCGEWTPDGRYFFFRRVRDGRANIWVMDERKGLFSGAARKPLQLTSGPLQYSAAVPIRDGRRLLVVGGQTRGENLRFDPDTRGFVRHNVGGRGRWFAFSRDGEWVAYVEHRDTETILYRSRIDGSERLQLTQPPLQLLVPRWSPDGTRIAFMGRLPGQPWKIHIVGPRGGEPQLVVEGNRAEADPDWGPDGTSLMFGRPPNYLAESSAPKAIHLLDLSTRELSTLPGSDGLFAPRWSPGGRFVAALTLDQATFLLFDFGTRSWSELGRFGTVHNPVWSRGERFLYFEVVDEASVYRIRMSDRAVEKVVDLKEGWTSAYGGCIFEGLTPDDSPLVSCHRFDPDIYALDWEIQ